MNIHQTTPAIQRAYGASHSIHDLRVTLASLRKESAAQAPYFDGRLLDRIAKLEQVITLAEAEANGTSILA